MTDHEFNENLAPQPPQDDLTQGETHSDGPGTETAAPAPIPASPAAQKPRFRDRVFGLRSMIAVSLAGLVLGGLGGTAIGAVAGHGDRDRDPGGEGSHQELGGSGWQDEGGEHGPVGPGGPPPVPGQR